MSRKLRATYAIAGRIAARQGRKPLLYEQNGLVVGNVT